MAEHVTLVRPGHADDASGASLPLPADLLAQMRGRVRILALLLLIGFGLDLVIAGFLVGGAALTGQTLSPGSTASAKALAANAVGCAGSIGMWWVAGRPKIAPARLLTLGLSYESLMCLLVSGSTFWQFYRDNGVLPNLTWAPVIIILFPLIMPGPPRRLLVGSIAAGAMPLLALWALVAAGQVSATGDAVASAIVASGFAVGFAYVGARTVYGLGRQVAAARELGSYRLEERLGAGGMGEVWRARHRLLARPAAVKVIRHLAGDASASREATRRFEREAQAIASLRSPHTVELFDFGVAEHGAFYYAMELLDGVDADALIRRFGPLPAERVIHIIRGVCHSLSEAHARRLVHRDIKPANVFLCRYGEDCDFVKLLDFGIVKGRDDPTGADTALTGDHVIAGTPGFLAPEQAAGSGTIDGRADLYATGCLAYWLLTGQPVFSGDSPMAIVMHHLRTTPTPPSVRSELPISAALDRIVLDCLAKDPTDRPATARILAERLDALPEAGHWTAERATSWWAAHLPEAAVADESPRT